jgi:hypothetical protein
MACIMATGVLVCLSDSPLSHFARRQRHGDEGWPALLRLYVTGRIYSTHFLACLFPGKVQLSKTSIWRVVLA